MSRLRIFSENDPSHPRLSTSDHAEMAKELEKIGVAFEQWQATAPVAPGDAPETIMDAYRADIDRLVAEFFTVKSGKIQEVQALLFNLDDSEPTGWDTHWYGPGRGGWHNMPTGQ